MFTLDELLRRFFNSNENFSLYTLWDNYFHSAHLPLELKQCNTDYMCLHVKEFVKKSLWDI